MMNDHSSLAVAGGDDCGGSFSSNSWREKSERMSLPAEIILHLDLFS